MSYRGKAEHKEYNVVREEAMTRFKLYMYHVESEELKQRMRKHPRVTKSNVFLKDSIDSDSDILD